jgi:DNA-directed RNA polymerase specialized sigma24 family protein
VKPAVDQKEKMLQFWREGMKVREIADKFQISIGHVGKCLSKANSEGSGVRMSNRMLATWGLRQLGKKRKEIAADLGISEDRVKTYLWLMRRELKRGKKT